MIPEFPTFKKLEITDKEIIESFTKQYPPYSDFNFISLWSWDTKGEAHFSVLNDNLIIKFSDYVTDEPFYSFLGVNKPENTIDTLLQFSQKELGVNHLRLIPSHSLKLLANREEYSIVEEKGAFDYVYNLAEIYRYKGSSLKKTTANSITPLQDL